MAEETKEEKTVREHILAAPLPERVRQAVAAKRERFVAKNLAEGVAALVGNGHADNSAYVQQEINERMKSMERYGSLTERERRLVDAVKEAFPALKQSAKAIESREYRHPHTDYPNDTGADHLFVTSQPDGTPLPTNGGQIDPLLIQVQASLGKAMKNHKFEFTSDTGSDLSSRDGSLALTFSSRLITAAERYGNAIYRHDHPQKKSGAAKE